MPTEYILYIFLRSSTPREKIIIICFSLDSVMVLQCNKERNEVVPTCNVQK